MSEVPELKAIAYEIFYQGQWKIALEESKWIIYTVEGGELHGRYAPVDLSLGKDDEGCIVFGEPRLRLPFDTAEKAREFLIDYVDRKQASELKRRAELTAQITENLSKCPLDTLERISSTTDIEMIREPGIVESDRG